MESMYSLFNDLMHLCDVSDSPFFYSDQSPRPGELYRIFSYHFQDGESWNKPNALESRGVMFEIDRDGWPLRIASRPMHKFFNKFEASTLFGTPKIVMNKADGSLISSYLSKDGDVLLKSKASIGSDFAKLAQELLEADPNLYQYVLNSEKEGRTVNMELVSSDLFFRIVVHYDKSQLIIINERYRDTGEYYPFDKIPQEYFVGIEDVSVLDQLETAKDMEGYVCIDDAGNWYKMKCEWYVRHHRIKAVINNKQQAIETILNEELDDILFLMRDHQDNYDQMLQWSHKVVHETNLFINKVTAIYNKYKHLDRKDFVFAIKPELTSLEFTAAMKAYTDKPENVNWKNFFLKVYNKFDWYQNL